MDTKIKYVSDDRRYKIVIIILVSIIVLFYVAIPIYRKLYDKFFIYYKKENPSISTGIGLYGKPEKPRFTMKQREHIPFLIPSNIR